MPHVVIYARECLIKEENGGGRGGGGGLIEGQENRLEVGRKM